jgi:predicted Zn-dependent peptidase
MRQPAIVAERTDIRRADPDVKQAGIYYKKVVRIEEKDVLATMAATGIIESFLGSRLSGSPFHTIVEKGKFPESATSMSLVRIAPNTYVLDISASVAAGLAPEQLLGAISDYVDALARNGISARTIERLKSRWATRRGERDQTPDLATSEFYNWLIWDHRYDDYLRIPQRIAAVSPEAVAEVLRALSGPGRIVTGTLTPFVKEATR